MSNATNRSEIADQSRTLVLKHKVLVGNWFQFEEHLSNLSKTTGEVLNLYLAEKNFYLNEDASENLNIAWQETIRIKEFNSAAAIWALRARNHLRLGRVAEALSTIDEAINWANKSGRAELASYLATRGLIW